MNVIAQKLFNQLTVKVDALGQQLILLVQLKQLIAQHIPVNQHVIVNLHVLGVIQLQNVPLSQLVPITQ